MYKNSSQKQQLIAFTISFDSSYQKPIPVKSSRVSMRHEKKAEPMQHIINYTKTYYMYTHIQDIYTLSETCFKDANFEVSVRQNTDT